MSFKKFVLSVAIAIEVLSVNAAISPASMIIKERAEEALQVQMLTANSKTIPCHTHYLEVLKNLLDTYEANVQQCEKEESEQILQNKISRNLNRKDTEKYLNSICECFDTLKEESENLKFFERLSSLEGSVVPVFNDSSKIAGWMRQENYVVKIQKEKCTTNAERVYMVGATKATDDLNACYANGGVIPSAPATLYHQQDLGNKMKLEHLKSAPLSYEKSKNGE